MAEVERIMAQFRAEAEVRGTAWLQAVIGAAMERTEQ